MLLLKVFNTIQEAEIVKGMLECNGIPAFVANHNNLYTPVFDGVYVYVNKKDASKALELLKRHGD